MLSTAEYWLPRQLVAFMGENTRFKLKLKVVNRDDIVRSLAAQDIDIALMGQPPGEFKVTA